MKEKVLNCLFKAKNLDICIELIKEKGKFNILSEYANFYDRRTYFKVNENGDIFQKTYNPITLLYLFCDDEKKLADYLFKYSEQYREQFGYSVKDWYGEKSKEYKRTQNKLTE